MCRAESQAGADGRAASETGFRPIWSRLPIWDALGIFGPVFCRFGPRLGTCLAFMNRHDVSNTLNQHCDLPPVVEHARATFLHDASNDSS